MFSEWQSCEQACTDCPRIVCCAPVGPEFCPLIEPRQCPFSVRQTEMSHSSGTQGDLTCGWASRGLALATASCSGRLHGCITFCAHETRQRQHGLLSSEPPGTQPSFGDLAPHRGRASRAGQCRLSISPHRTLSGGLPQCMHSPPPCAWLTPWGLPLPLAGGQQAQP